MADKAQSTVTIKADPATVMAAIADLEKYPTWSKTVQKVDVLEVGADGRPIRARFHVSAMGNADEHVFAYTWAGPTAVSWTMVEGGSAMSALDAGYTLRDLGGGSTEVTYQVTLELKMKLPGMLRRRAVNGQVENTLTALKEHIEG